jgi:hypothetical protein
MGGPDEDSAPPGLPGLEGEDDTPEDPPSIAMKIKDLATDLVEQLGGGDELAGLGAGGGGDEPPLGAGGGGGGPLGGGAPPL